MSESQPPPPDPDATPVGRTPEEQARLFASLERELRQLARSVGGKNGHTLQPTALVNEAWLRLCGTNGRAWNDRAHFLRSAALTMRRILLDHYKRPDDTRRNGAREPLDEVLEEFVRRSGGDFLALNEALDQLAKEHPQAADYVHLRFFGGRSNEEAAAVMGLSPRTGDRLWAFARAWLRIRMSP